MYSLRDIQKSSCSGNSSVAQCKFCFVFIFTDGTSMHCRVWYLIGMLTSELLILVLYYFHDFSGDIFRLMTNIGPFELVIHIWGHLSYLSSLRAILPSCQYNFLFIITFLMAYALHHENSRSFFVIKDILPLKNGKNIVIKVI